MMINFFLRLEQILACILLMASVFLVVFASLGRWAGHPIIWSVDIAQLLFIWLCFVGATRAMRNDRHVGIENAVSLLPNAVQRWIKLIVLIVMLACVLAIIPEGMELYALNKERRFSDTNLSYSVVTLAVPVGMALIATSLIPKIFKQIAQLRHMAEAPE